MKQELKTKGYFLGISLFGLACTSTLVLTQLSSISGLMAASPRARLDDWRFYLETSQLEFTLSGVTQPQHFYLRQPPRLVIDLPNTKLGNVTTQQSFSGAIKSIRISQFNADDTRIVLDLLPGTFLDANQVQLQSFSWQNQNRWVLSPINNLASGNFNNNQGPLFPQLPGNNTIPGNFNNNQQGPLFPQLPGNNTIPNTYPTTNNFPIRPQVSVPPLNINHSSQPQPFNSNLPPATFNNQSGFATKIAPVPQSNFPVPNLPNYQQNNPGPRVVPYGQPIPQMAQ
ncbi:MAG: AMIN domain-containing protein [Calothrix sp. MO_192.B10]|nr:AMIN domain-containing protein [Calothrix sp. MO_192.B10]